MKTLLAFLFALTIHLQAAPTEMREWTATNGQTVEAEALKVQNGKVMLKKKNGKTVPVPIDKLIEADREFLEQHFGAEENTTDSPTSADSVNKADEGEAADDLPHPLGKTTSALKCGAYHYFLYFPKSLRKGEQHPVLFIMDPGGGKGGTVRRYINGAERNRWILAISKESKNKYKQSQQAVDAMIEEVTSTLPVDKKRLYVSGFSGGCRMSFQTATKHKIAGVIACGAGASGNIPKGSQPTYGLCGTTCFNRHDMAITFDKIKNKNSVLRFFPAPHHWAGAELLDDAITHLNGIFLIKNASKYSSQLERYEASVAELIQSTQGKDPMRAFMWTSYMTERYPKGANKNFISQVHNKLGASDANTLYVEGLKGVHKFAVKKLATSVDGYKSLDPKMVSACEREAKKYAGTPWEHILNQMAKKCPQP